MKFLSLDDGIHYIPEFITEQHETKLLSHVYASPKPKWTALSNRRLQNWGGVVGSNCLISAEPLPIWLVECVDMIMGLHLADGQFTFPAKNRPNHVLVNEYLPAQGIMPHTDGPAFFPLISTISLGSHTVLDFYEQESLNEGGILEKNYQGSLLLEPRSLLLVSQRAYQLLHGIEERSIDKLSSDKKIINRMVLGAQIENAHEMHRRTRVSLTIRNVPNVKNVFGKTHLK